MDIWIFSTAVILLMVAFFTYTTFVVLKQKRYSEVQKDFINTITHEVKTPVTTIMLSAQALQRQASQYQPALAQQANTYTQLIVQEVGRIKDQVEQVLQSAHVEKETLVLNTEGVDIHALISEVTESMQALLQQHQASPGCLHLPPAQIPAERPPAGDSNHPRHGLQAAAALKNQPLYYRSNTRSVYFLPPCSSCRRKIPFWPFGGLMVFSIVMPASGMASE